MQYSGKPIGNGKWNAPAFSRLFDQDVCYSFVNLLFCFLNTPLILLCFYPPIQASLSILDQTSKLNMLSSIFHRADNAENQDWALVILATHMCIRGCQVGAAAGLALGLDSARILRRQNMSTSLLRMTVLKSAGVGVCLGHTLMLGVLPWWMHGCEPIEIQDRAHQLLANEGQEQVDNWTISSALIGTAWTIFKGTAKGPRAWTIAAGGAGLGSTAGLGLLMAHRLFTGTKSARNKSELVTDVW